MGAGQVALPAGADADFHTARPTLTPAYALVTGSPRCRPQDVGAKCFLIFSALGIVCSLRNGLAIEPAFAAPTWWGGLVPCSPPSLPSTLITVMPIKWVWGKGLYSGPCGDGGIEAAFAGDLLPFGSLYPASNACHPRSAKSPNEIASPQMSRLFSPGLLLLLPCHQPKEHHSRGNL